MEIKQIDCNVSYIDSREVAEMVEKTHANLLKDILQIQVEEDRP